MHSYGIVLWETFSRQVPYGCLSKFEDIRDEIVAGRRPTLPPGMPYDYRHLVELCLRDKPVERPSFTTIVQELEEQQTRHAV